MNLELFEYGIMTENSDIRAHVSRINKTIYVFQTKHGVDAIEKHKPPLATATQPGANGKTTGVGWLVKYYWVQDIRRIKRDAWSRWEEYKNDWSTTKKGRWAVDCVLGIMRKGYFPLWIDAQEDDRKNIQVKGTDILIFARKKIQVKNDYKLGESGNLFLQKAECNPFKNH